MVGWWTLLSRPSTVIIFKNERFWLVSAFGIPLSGQKRSSPSRCGPGLLLCWAWASPPKHRMVTPLCQHVRFQLTVEFLLFLLFLSEAAELVEEESYGLPVIPTFAPGGRVVKHALNRVHDRRSFRRVVVVGSAFITFHADSFQETKQPRPFRAGAAVEERIVVIYAMRTKPPL